MLNMRSWAKITALTALTALLVATAIVFLCPMKAASGISSAGDCHGSRIAGQASISGFCDFMDKAPAGDLTAINPETAAVFQVALLLAVFLGHVLGICLPVGLWLKSATVRLRRRHRASWNEIKAVLESRILKHLDLIRNSAVSLA